MIEMKNFRRSFSFHYFMPASYPLLVIQLSLMGTNLLKVEKKTGSVCMFYRLL